MSDGLQRFNDVVKEDGEIRNGMGGKLAAKYNLPLSLNMSFKTGGESKVSFQVVIPQAEIATVSDELKELFGEADTRFSDLSDVTKISFELDTHGEVVPNTLKLESPKPQKPVINSQAKSSFASEQSLCENCRTNQGHQFAFTYGKKTGQSSYSTQSGVVKTTTSTTSYEIAGQKSVAICDSCREDFFRKNLLKGSATAIFASLPIILFVYLLIVTDGQAEGLAQVLMFVTLPIFSGPIALVGLAAFFNVVEDGSQRAGENLAIDLKREELMQQGYDSFWNSRRYEQLKRFGK